MGGIPSSGGGGSSFTGASSAPSVSADGRCVAFVSTATNLVPGVTNLQGEIYVRDLQAGVTHWASANVADQCVLCPPGPYHSFNPVVSADGRFVAFVSTDRYLATPQLPPGPAQIYVRDLVAGTTRLVTVNQDGAPSR